MNQAKVANNKQHINHFYECQNYQKAHVIPTNNTIHDLN